MNAVLHMRLLCDEHVDGVGGGLGKSVGLGRGAKTAGMDVYLMVG